MNPGPPIEKMFPDVKPVEGEIMRYHVKSRSGPDAHLVDLVEYGFNGQCDCENFRYRCEPKLQQGTPLDGRFRCHHIKQALAHFTATMQRNLWKLWQETNKPKLPRPPTPRPQREKRDYILYR
jgi:hypothetical protein